MNLQSAPSVDGMPAGVIATGACRPLMLTSLHVYLLSHNSFYRTPANKSADGNTVSLSMTHRFTACMIMKAKFQNVTNNNNNAFQLMMS